MPILFTDDIFLEHNTGQHPERAERLRAINRRLEASDVAAKFERGEVKPATRETIARLHDPAYITSVEQFAEHGGGRLDADTVVSRRSFDAALYAAGAATQAVDEVISGRHKRAMCLIRPPGHHALPKRAMGFCLFNNIAVAARHAQAVHNLKRILIVDWDVHHGNGTQDMFYEDADVFFFSAHRFPFYPGTGDGDETGAGDGLGTTFNLPLAFGISRKEYLERFERMLADAAERCRPELILLSAGFDAHAEDPIGSLGLESEDFGTLTKMVASVANDHCGGKLVSLLEGGYNVDALAESVEIHLSELVT